MQEVVKHFYDISKEPNVDRPQLDGVVFRSLSNDDNLVLLSARFSLQELDYVVSQCGDNKSWGSNGFNFSFLKRF